jgi:signal transduction histidine kinase
MQPRSLAFRLVLSSGVIACIMLLAAALLLNGLFQRALERNFDERLRAVMDGVLGSVELAQDGSPNLPTQLADTRFSIPLSGWYWQITPIEKGGKDMASASLLEKRLAVPDAALNARGGDGVASFYLLDSENKQLRAIEQRFELFDSDKDFSVLVAGNFDELKAEVASFRNYLYTILGVLGLGLLAATLAQVRYGLRPMLDMQQKLNAIRSGNAEYLEGNFPKEMQPVADEMNLVIKTGFEILDRSRMQVGNLAHALKTPLAVLTNEAAANKGKFAAIVGEQTQVMKDQIDLYLDRARRATQARAPGVSCDVEPVVQALARTLQRIHQHKHIEIDVTVSAGLKFRGDRQDLEEMAGNLMDNACKWAKGRIAVSAGLEPVTETGRSYLFLAVDDDGPGIPADQRERAMKRGQRLDEHKPGSGLGLNIISETAAIYDGSIALSDASMGGLRAYLRLPAVSAS